MALSALVVERCIDSFYFFCKHILGFDLLTDQTHKRWCDDLQLAIYKNKKRFMRLKPRGCYKCLRKGTQLFSYGINEDNNLIDAELFNQKDFFEEGIEVTFASGRKHICTKDHMFKTIDGWETARVGLRNAVVQNIPKKSGELIGGEIDADIFWDRIISIKDVGMQEFSAIGSDIENYISQDGVIHHNTTVYGIGFILWVWGCISPDIRIFYTSSNAMLLEEVADSVSRYIGDGKSETIYSYIFGITKDLTAKNTSDVFNISGRTGKGFSLILRTSGGSTQGIHPNIIIVDDPLGQKDRESQAERDSKIRWFDTLNPLLTPWIDKNKGIVFESIFYIGTRWHMKDLVDYIVNELNDKLPELLRWDIEIESIFTKDKEPSYPEFFPLEKIMAMKATMSDEFFSCQMENNPLTEQLMIFNLKKLSFIREEQFDLSQGELLCVFDPSLGKRHSDYPAVWWVNYYNDRVVFFDAIDEKVEISLIVHQIAAKNQKYSCRHMIFEDNGILLVEQALQDAHSRINHRIYIESVHHSSNKEERIMSMQPDLYSGFGVFMEDYKTRYPEAMNQIIFYPVYGHDDFPDCAQIAIEHYRKPHFQFKRYEEIL